MRSLTMFLALFLLAGIVTACDGSDGGQGPEVGATSTEQSTEQSGDRDAVAIAAGVETILADAVAEQVEEGIPEGPRGRALTDCPVLDEPGRGALADLLDVSAADIEVLTATISDPEGMPRVSCPIRFGEASAGAVVLTVGPTADDVDGVRELLLEAEFEEVADASAQGLDDDKVLLFDATTFEASRAVWTDEGLEISVTANTDVVGEGRLLELLAVAVAEVERTVS